MVASTSTSGTSSAVAPTSTQTKETTAASTRGKTSDTQKAAQTKVATPQVASGQTYTKAQQKVVSKKQAFTSSPDTKNQEKQKAVPLKIATADQTKQRAEKSSTTVKEGSTPYSQNSPKNNQKIVQTKLVSYTETQPKQPRASTPQAFTAGDQKAAQINLADAKGALKLVDAKSELKPTPDSENKLKDKINANWRSDGAPDNVNQVIDVKSPKNPLLPGIIKDKEGLRPPRSIVQSEGTRILPPPPQTGGRGRDTTLYPTPDTNGKVLGISASSQISIAVGAGITSEDKKPKIEIYKPLPSLNPFEIFAFYNENRKGFSRIETTAHFKRQYIHAKGNNPGVANPVASAVQWAYKNVPFAKSAIPAVVENRLGVITEGKTNNDSQVYLSFNPGSKDVPLVKKLFPNNVGKEGITSAARTINDRVENRAVSMQSVSTFGEGYNLQIRGPGFYAFKQNQIKASNSGSYPHQSIARPNALGTLVKKHSIRGYLDGLEDIWTKQNPLSTFQKVKQSFGLGASVYAEGGINYGSAALQTGLRPTDKWLTHEGNLNDNVKDTKESTRKKAVSNFTSGGWNFNNESIINDKDKTSYLTLIVPNTSINNGNKQINASRSVKLIPPDAQKGEYSTKPDGSVVQNTLSGTSEFKVTRDRKANENLLDKVWRKTLGRDDRYIPINSAVSPSLVQYASQDLKKRKELAYMTPKVLEDLNSGKVHYIVDPVTGKTVTAFKVKDNVALPARQTQGLPGFQIPSEAIPPQVVDSQGNIKIDPKNLPSHWTDHRSLDGKQPVLTHPGILLQKK